MVRHDRKDKVGKYTIFVPPSRSLRSTLEWVTGLYQSPESDLYTFDFGAMDWIEPFPLLFLSANIRRFRKSKPEARFIATNFRTHSYAAHMGFFEAFNLHFGNKPGEAQGSDTYLPITSISVAYLNHEAGKRSLQVGDVLEGDTAKLAQLLTQEKSSHLVDTLAYTLREIMRNAVEHSEGDEFEYCGQYWPTQDKVEIAILDCGIGVQKSLSANPNLKILSGDDALRLALLPGISGKTNAGNKIREYDHWANSGYGLYITSRLCAVGGSFFICSDKRGLSRKGDGQEKYYDCSFQGTALRMVLHTSSISDLKGCLRQLRKEGEEAARLMRGAHPRASGASGGFRAKS